MPAYIPETYSLYLAFDLDTDKFGLSEEKEQEFKQRLNNIISDEGYTDDDLFNYFEEVDRYVESLQK